VRSISLKSDCSVNAVAPVASDSALQVESLRVAFLDTTDFMKIERTDFCGVMMMLVDMMIAAFWNVCGMGIMRVRGTLKGKAKIGCVFGDIFRDICFGPRRSSSSGFALSVQ
jgi:hypothetical protein